MSTAYVIEHNLVGVHLRGDVVRFEGEALPQGVDVERLLRLGAIREATPTEAENAVAYGDVVNDIPRPFPPVPFQVVKEIVREAPTEPTDAQDDTPKSRAAAKR